VARAVDEGDVAHEFEPVVAVRPIAERRVFFVGAEGAVTPWTWTGRVFAFVDLSKTMEE
jgi:hypothetical protein